MEKPSMNASNLSAIEIPDLVMGSIKRFRNFDPERILDFQFRDGKLYIYMNEQSRLESIQEFQSTIEAFLYEVKRAVRPEVSAFLDFQFDQDFQRLQFTVKRSLFEQDSTAEMIKLSLVEDAIKYQLYSRKPIGVNVQYRDGLTGEVFINQLYPDSKEL